MIKLFTRKSSVKYFHRLLFAFVLLSAGSLKASSYSSTSGSHSSINLPGFSGLKLNVVPGNINYSRSLLAPRIESFSPKQGHAGSRFKLTGSNLSGLSSLKIGGTNTIVLSNNGTELVGMVTPKTRSGTISVTTENGIANSAKSFSVTPTQNYSTSGVLQGSGESASIDSYGNAGVSVAVSADGMTMATGAPSPGAAGNTAGGVFIFVNTGGTWTQQGLKLRGTPAYDNASQGNSISLSADGNTLLIGAPYAVQGGAAFVFSRSGTTWTQQSGLITPADPTGSTREFGNSVSLSADGNTAAVGNQEDNNSIGAAWIFTRTGSTWTQQGLKLVGTGYTYTPAQGTVSLSGDGSTLALGGQYDNSGVGATWIFTRSGTAWSQQGSKLVGSGYLGSPRQGRTTSLSYDGNTLTTGGEGDDSGNGAFWIFNRSVGVWTQNGSKISGTGHSYYFARTNNLALSGDGTVIAVGNEFEGTLYNGTAYIYTLTNGSWVLHGSRITGGQHSQLGSAVGLNYDGTVLGIGCAAYNQSSAGGTFLYTIAVTPTVQSTNLVFTKTSASSTTASWTPGNGMNHAVFMSTVLTTAPAIANNTTYSAAGFGLGSTAGAGWYCVYNGPSTTAVINGLSAGTSYRVVTLDYNGPVGGELYLTSPATGNPATVTTVIPFIYYTGSLSALSTIFGTPSSTGMFSVSGQALSAAILVTAPSGFEVSASYYSGFAGSVTVEVSGKADPTPVYIRLAALSGVAGSPYSGNVVLSSPGLKSVNVATVSSTVAKASLTLLASNFFKFYGSTLTSSSGSSYFNSNGLQNADVISSVTVTYGTGADPKVATGFYTDVVTVSLPVALSGTFDPGNYTIGSHLGKITVIPAPLTLTPAGPLKSYGTTLAATTGGMNFTPVTGVNGEVVTGLTLTPDAAGISATTAVGSAYQVTPSGATGTNGFLVTNYNITYTPYTGIVTAPALVVTLLNQPKVYGTALLAGVTSNTAGFSVSGAMAPGETITGLTLTPDAAGLSASAAAGSGYTVQPSLPTGTGGFQAANYAIAYVAFTGTVATRPLNVTATGVNKVYNNTTAAVLTLSDDRVSGDLFSTSYSTASFADKNAGTLKTVTASGFSITGVGAANYTLATSSVTTSATISPAPVTLTAQAATKVYTKTVSSGMLPVISGVLGTDGAGLVLSQTYDTFNAGTGKTLTPSAVIMDGNNGLNYAVSTVSSSLGVISPAPVVVTAVAATKVNDNTTSSAIMPTVTGLLAADMVSKAPFQTYDTPSEGTGKTLTPAGLVISDGNGGANYSITYQSIASGIITSAVDRSLAYLSGLSTSSGMLSPVFEERTSAYNVQVPNSVSSVTLTPTAGESVTSIRVNGFTVTSGSASEPVSLTIGDNTIVTQVTALDGMSMQTYTLTVNRAFLAQNVAGNNILSPNGDGVNDKWVVKGIKNFPNNIVTVYDRSGRVVFTQKTYANTWDGFYRGALLRGDTYYYTINLGDGSKTIRGFITIFNDRK